MQKTSKHTSQIVDGKWISLARSWLTDNTPCTRETMFIELGMLMPGNIRCANIIATRSMLVKDAYRRIYKTSKIPEVVTAPPLPRKHKGKGNTEAVRALLESNTTVTYRDVLSISYGRTILQRLGKRGECICLSPGVYRKSQVD